MTISTFTVATGAYIRFLEDLIPDIDRYVFTDQSIEIHVFTDQPEHLTRVTDAVSARSHVVVHSVPPLRWPQATLLRYELIAGAMNEDAGDVCMHLDADLRIVSDVGSELDPQKWVGGIAAVRHPGYWRSGSPVNLRDLRGRVTSRIRGRGRMGAWESNKRSQAYVPWSKQRTYVCGGVWMGVRQPFQQMVSELAEATRLDSQRGIIPRWHDESYLNAYIATHDVTLLDPSYCYAAEYPWLRSLQPRIIAVDKGDWQRV